VRGLREVISRRSFPHIVQCVEATARTCDLSVHRRQTLPLALGGPFNYWTVINTYNWSRSKKINTSNLHNVNSLNSGVEQLLFFWVWLEQIYWCAILLHIIFESLANVSSWCNCLRLIKFSLIGKRFESLGLILERMVWCIFTRLGAIVAKANQPNGSFHHKQNIYGAMLH
jgi:hypothetical protein